MRDGKQLPPIRRGDWVGTWGATFGAIERYTAASYQVRSGTPQADTWCVVAERTIFFRPGADGQELLQVCRTEGVWARRDGRWLLRSQRELRFPEDGEVAPAEAPPRSERIRQLRDRLAADGGGAVDRFLAELHGSAPLVEAIASDPNRRLVTFVYRGDAGVRGVRMAGGPYQSSPKELTRLERSDLWYRTETIPADARFVYFFTVTGPRARTRADGRAAGEAIVTLPANDPLIAGASLGGVAAVFAGESHPEVFGNVLSQSGAFWHHPEAGRDGWLAERFAAGEKRPTRFWLEVGAFESTSMVANNRRLRDVLRAKGYPVEYREFPGGHDYLTWRDSLAAGLRDLLGAESGER